MQSTEQEKPVMSSNYHLAATAIRQNFESRSVPTELYTLDEGAKRLFLDTMFHQVLASLPMWQPLEQAWKSNGGQIISWQSK